MLSDRTRAVSRCAQIDARVHRLGQAWLGRTRPSWVPVVLAALILLPLESGAAVYKCKGADGSTVFADAPCGADAQVQAVRTLPPVSDTPVPATGVGGRSAQRDEASVCWTSKYDVWRRQNPPLAANPGVNLEKVQQLQRECHWTSRTRAFAAPEPLVLHDTPRMTQIGTGTMDAARGAPTTAGGVDGYLSDARLLESRQSAAPGRVIRYSDPVNGALLKSVLDPARVSSALDATMHQRGTRQFDELRHIVQPMQQRYAQAFNDDPRGYEAEYLDTLDITAMLIRHSVDQMRTASPPPAPAPSATAADAKLAQSVASLAQSMNGLMATVAKTMAKSIRQQVSGGRFSPAGAQRATGIAKSLESV